MSQKLYKLTAVNHKTLKQYTDYWANLLGLQNWEIHVDIGKFNKEETPDYRGCCCASNTDKLALIYYADRFDIEPNDYWLARTAFHECCEILFTEIEDSMKGSVSYGRALIHSIIRCLENTMFDNAYKEAIKNLK